MLKHYVYFCHHKGLERTDNFRRYYRLEFSHRLCYILFSSPFFCLRFTTLSRELYFPSPFFHFSLHICLKRLHNVPFLFEKAFAHAWNHSSLRMWITQKSCIPRMSLHVDSFIYLYVITFIFCSYHPTFAFVSVHSHFTQMEVG